jgi:hypothetical protein
MTGAPIPSEEPKQDPAAVRDRGEADASTDKGGSADKGSDTSKAEAPFEGPKGDPAEGKRS